MTIVCVFVQYFCCFFFLCRRRRKTIAEIAILNLHDSNHRRNTPNVSVRGSSKKKSRLKKRRMDEELDEDVEVCYKIEGNKFMGFH